MRPRVHLRITGTLWYVGADLLFPVVFSVFNTEFQSAPGEEPGFFTGCKRSAPPQERGAETDVTRSKRPFHGDTRLKQDLTCRSLDYIDFENHTTNDLNCLIGTWSLRPRLHRVLKAQCFGSSRCRAYRERHHEDA